MVTPPKEKKDLGSAPTGEWVTLDREGRVTDDMGLCRGVVFVCRDGPPSYYPDVRPFPQIGEVQVLACPTAHLGSDRLLRPQGDRLRVTLHGRAAVSSATVWAWLAACCPTAELTCVFHLVPGSSDPAQTLHAHLALCGTTHRPFLRTLVLVDPRGQPHILAGGSWRAPWLWQLRHLVIDTWALGGGAPVLRDLVGLDTLDWTAHAHDVPGWPVTGPLLLSMVDAVEMRLPHLRTLALVDTYQPEPELLPPDLYGALPALERLTISQSADHLPRAWAVRPHLDPHLIDERLVQPTLRFADAVLDCPTLPTDASFLYRTAVRARQSAKKYLFPATLAYRAAVTRARGQARAACVTVEPRRPA